MMAAVPRHNSLPELIIRRMIHSMGYRFRLQARELPGTPDIVLRPKKKAIFVHGCFWHRHGCRKATIPATNRKFWLTKFLDNQRRDRRVVRKLRDDGWDVLIIWECQIRRPKYLQKKLLEFLSR
jgi:DNA mismatch endonuclease (patch repair protein)